VLLLYVASSRTTFPISMLCVQAEKEKRKMYNARLFSINNPSNANKNKNKNDEDYTYVGYSMAKLHKKGEKHGWFLLMMKLIHIF
jgi:hypothetical protein